MGTDGPPDPWAQDRMNLIEADQERTRWMDTGIRVRWGPLGYLPRSAEAYIGWTIRFCPLRHRGDPAKEH